MLLQAVAPEPTVAWSAEMYRASRVMAEATAAIAAFADSVGPGIDPALDPNRTGLIGPAYTELFTTLGDLEAKRTTTNPDVAGLLVHLLTRAGVRAGDTIAVAASGSFPALAIASVVAAEAMAVHPVTLVSLGASSYGATRPELHVLHMYERLRRAGLIGSRPAAVSLGGEHDVGAEFDPQFRDSISRDLVTRGLRLVREPDLRRNVTRRMALYFGEAGTRRIAAFVNVGGSAASLGSSPMILDVEPGLSGRLDLPPEERRGVLFRMAARGVPVIHLLHVRGLARRHGLPWDPIPLPAAGSTPLRDPARPETAGFWIVTALYLGGLGAVSVWGRGVRRRAG
jgi:poly-gamma-glutamate system protein